MLTFPAFLNATLRKPKWLAANPLAFSTWVKLACRSAEDETGGRLEGAKGWTDHIWLTLANVNRGGVDAAVTAGLCAWDGGDIVVAGYDQGAEGKVKTLRDNGAYGHLGAAHGAKGGRPRKETPSETPSGGLTKPPLSDPIRSDPYPTDPSQGVWGPSEWKRKYGIPWSAAKNKLTYGHPGDSKACAELAAMLEVMPKAEQLAAQAAAEGMFATYLADPGEWLVKTHHPFVGFVQRFSALRVDAARAAAPAKVRPHLRSVDDLPPPGLPTRRVALAALAQPRAAESSNHKYEHDRGNPPIASPRSS